MELEYIEAASEPESVPNRPHPDWIAAIDARGGRCEFIVTGCYDSGVRVFDAKNIKAAALANGNGHTSAVKAVAIFKSGVATGKDLQIVSGSKDRSVKVWKVRIKQNEKQNRNSHATSKSITTEIVQQR